MLSYSYLCSVHQYYRARCIPRKYKILMELILVVSWEDLACRPGYTRRGTTARSYVDLQWRGNNVFGAQIWGTCPQGVHVTEVKNASRGFTHPRVQHATYSWCGGSWSGRSHCAPHTRTRGIYYSVVQQYYCTCNRLRGRPRYMYRVRGTSKKNAISRAQPNHVREQ